MNRRTIVGICLLSCFLMISIPLIPTVQAIEVEKEVNLVMNERFENIKEIISEKLLRINIIKIIWVIIYIVIALLHYWFYWAIGYFILALYFENILTIIFGEGGYPPNYIMGAGFLSAIFSLVLIFFWPFIDLLLAPIVIFLYIVNLLDSRIQFI